jgi:hypothetical protein
MQVMWTTTGEKPQVTNVVSESKMLRCLVRVLASNPGKKCNCLVIIGTVMCTMLLLGLRRLK